MANSIIQTETKAGEPIQAGRVRAIPFSRVVRIQIPGLAGGVIWNRPTSVVVIDQDGEEQVFPVQDVTRQGQIAILAAGLLGSLLIWLALRQRK